MGIGTRLFLAIVIIIIVLIIIPPFNDLLTDIIEDMLIDGLGLTGYESAWWHLFPLIIFGYLLIFIPLKIIMGGGRFGGSSSDDDIESFDDGDE